MKLLLIFILTVSACCIGGKGGIGGKAGAGRGAAPPPPTFTVVQSCSNFAGAATTVDCVFGSNFTTGDDLYIIGQGGNGVTPSISVASCTAIPSTSNDIVSNRGIHAWGNSTSTTACTVTYASGGAAASIQVVGIEISGSTSHTVDQHSLVYQGTANQCPAVTTTVNSDFIACSFTDAAGFGGTFTAGAGFTIAVQSGPGGVGIENETQSSAGAITPTWTYSQSNAFMLNGTWALEP